MKKIVTIILLIFMVLVVSSCENTTSDYGENIINEEGIPDSDINTETNTDKKEGVSPRHAPNMYVDWSGNSTYDAICVDWCCDKDALDTYWAVHNWDGGYAGFQNADGKHQLLLSLWDLPDGTLPTIEYVLGGKNGDFGGEGTGKQVFTNYKWEVGKWYSMCVERVVEGNKTIYTQYVKEEDGEWLKTAAISYPIVRDGFYGSSMFQEDFGFNNLMRSCKLKNAGGRIIGSGKWEEWDNCRISNSFFSDEHATWENGVQENIKFNCNWYFKDGYIWVQSGGEGFDTKEIEMPANVQLNN